MSSSCHHVERFRAAGTLQTIDIIFVPSVIRSEEPQCCLRCDLSKIHKCNSDKWPGGLSYLLLCLPALFVLDPVCTIPSDSGSLLSPSNLTSLGFWFRPISEGWYWSHSPLIFCAQMLQIRGWDLAGKNWQCTQLCLWWMGKFNLEFSIYVFFFTKNQYYISPNSFIRKKKKKGLLIFMPPTLTSITQSVFVLKPGKEEWLEFIGLSLKLQHSHQ